MKKLSILGILLLAGSAMGAWIPNWATTNSWANASNFVLSIAQTISGPTNGVTATAATNIAAYQAGIATNGVVRVAGTLIPNTPVTNVTTYGLTNLGSSSFGNSGQAVFDSYGNLISRTNSFSFPAIGLSAYGDSITTGTGASDAAHRYVSLLTNLTGLVLTNYGVSGDFAADQADQIYSNSVGQFAVSTYMIGANDHQTYTDNGRIADFQSILTAQAAWLAIPEANKLRGTNGTYTGATWAATGVYGGMGKNSGTPGEYVTMTNVRGTSLIIGTIAFKQGAIPGSRFSVTVDSVLQGTFTNEFNGDITTTPGGLTYAPRGLVLNGFSDIPHTVIITNVGGTTYFDWIAGITDGQMRRIGPSVYVATVLRQTPVGTWDATVASFNAGIKSVCSTLAGAGLNVLAVDVSSLVDPAADLSDGLHPNDTGHAKIAAEFAGAMTVRASGQTKQFGTYTGPALAKAWPNVLKDGETNHSLTDLRLTNTLTAGGRISGDNIRGTSSGNATVGAGSTIGWLRAADSWEAAGIEQLYSGSGFGGRMLFKANTGSGVNTLGWHMSLESDGTLKVTNSIIASKTVTATNGFMLPIQSGMTAAVAGLGILWNSNKVLYWITDIGTNSVSTSGGTSNVAEYVTTSPITNHVYGSNIDGTISVAEIDAQTLVVSNAPIFLDTSLTNAAGLTIAQEAAAAALAATNYAAGLVRSNALGTAAYAASSAFDAAGAGTTAAQNATNGVVNAALTDVGSRALVTLADTNWVIAQVSQLGSTHYFTAVTNSGALGGRTNNFITWLTVPSTVTTQSFQTPIASAYIRQNVSTNTYSVISAGPADVLSYIYRTGAGTLTLHYELYAYDTVSNVLYELAAAPDQTIPTGGGPVAYEFPMNVASDFIATNATKLVVACKMGSSVGTSTPLLSFVNGGQYGAHFSFSRPLSSEVIQGSQITGPVANATTASYVSQQPLTNDISGIVRYSTNLTTMAPDWNLKYSTITTNAAWVFLAPLNFVATEFQSTVLFVTNSTASAVAVTVPAGWHTQGTWYCTNVTTFTVSHYGTIFTNAIAFPLW